MRPFSFILWCSLHCLYGAAFFTSTYSPTPKRAANEMLLPIHSTTALMCEPVFTGDKSAATWYKDGKSIAKVTSTSNANYGNRTSNSEEPVPEVGFLLISDITLEDEGMYWCRRDDTNEAGEVFSLKVAYVEPLQKDRVIRFEPSKPQIGAPFMAHCQAPNAVPKPNIHWMLNSQPISHTGSDSLVLPNGTLFIKHFSLVDFGLYECVVSNFAGRTSTRAYVDPNQLLIPQLKNAIYQSSFIHRCGVLFRSSVLWFLVGCLVTSTAVLIYLVAALFCCRPSGNRLTIRPAMFLRTQAHLAPGFRKVIAPIPDLYYSPVVPEV